MISGFPEGSRNEPILNASAKIMRSRIWIAEILLGKTCDYFARLLVKECLEVLSSNILWAPGIVVDPGIFCVTLNAGKGWLLSTVDQNNASSRLVDMSRTTRADLAGRGLRLDIRDNF